ncbi:MAG: hypothetical protein IJ868_02170 [Prevotella sp.]|nr:hypothetical protein [Prevotella sp.]
MEKTQKILMTLYVGVILVTVLIVVLCETGVVQTGLLADDKQSEFFVTTILELGTLGGAFLGLRLFKFKNVHQELVTKKAPALLKFGVIRLLILELLMLLDTLFYYIYMNPTFGYLAIILLLCLPFVYPSMNRCIAETTEEEAQ